MVCRESARSVGVIGRGGGERRDTGRRDRRQQQVWIRERGRKEGRKERRKEGGRKDGRKEGRKDVRKEGRKEGRTEGMYYTHFRSSVSVSNL